MGIFDARAAAARSWFVPACAAIIAAIAIVSAGCLNPRPDDFPSSKDGVDEPDQTGGTPVEGESPPAAPGSNPEPADPGNDSSSGGAGGSSAGTPSGAAGSAGTAGAAGGASVDGSGPDAGAPDAGSQVTDANAEQP